MENAMRPFFRLKANFDGLIATMGWVAATVTLAGFAGRAHWLLDLCTHFRAQYLLALLAASILLARRLPRQALAFALLALLNAAILLPMFLPRATPAAGITPAIRAMLMNVNTYDGSPPRVAAAIAEFHPDILVLIEVSPLWLESLAPALTNFSQRLAEPRDDNFGIALYSRFLWTNAAPHLIGAAGVPTLRATIDTPDGPVTIIATHPVPPGGAQYSAWRNDQLARLPSLVHAPPAPVLLLGDLNTTPWNFYFNRLLRDAGFHDSARGRGLHPTWPVGVPLLWIPLDHCLHSPEIAIAARTVGPDVGSDHYPLIVDFCLKK